MGYIGELQYGVVCAKTADENKLGPWRKITTDGINRAACIGMFAVANANGADVITAADTANSSGVLIYGQIKMIADKNLVPIDFGYVASGTAEGYFKCIEDPDAEYDILEDSDGGTMSATGAAVGSVKLVDGTIDGVTAAPGTAHTTPVSKDLIDSSSLNATLGYQAFNIVGKVPTVANDGGPGTVPQFKYRVKIASGFKAAQG